MITCQSTPHKIYASRYEELEQAAAKKKQKALLTTKERVMRFTRDGAFKGAVFGVKLSFSSASTLLMTMPVTKGGGQVRRNFHFYLLVLALIALAAAGIGFAIGIGITLCLNEALDEADDSDDESEQIETPSGVIDFVTHGDKKVQTKAPISAVKLGEMFDYYPQDDGHNTDLDQQETGFLSDYSNE